MKEGRLSIRVYYEDTDFSGAVYHASYLRFFERGRTELLRGLGISQADAIDLPPAEQFAFVVRRMSVDFRRAARMDDVLDIETAVKAVRGASVVLGQSAHRADELIASAEVVIACVAHGRPRPLPGLLRERFAALTPAADA